jgi:hypothetical protein
MKSRCTTVPPIVTAVILLVSACNTNKSTQSYVPSTSPRTNYSVFRNTTSPAGTLPTCLTKVYRGPGKFTVLAAAGTFSGGTFSASGLSLWANIIVSNGIHQIPTYAPKLGVQYTIYYGTYKLDSGLVGCLYLAKIKYYGMSFNGAAAAWPNLHYYGTTVLNEEGPLTIAVKGISAKSGSGNLKLNDPTGKTIYTGTVKITGSKVIK